MSQHSQNIDFTIITPCYNENIAVIQFLEQIQSAISALPYTFKVVVVNDASIDNTANLLQQFHFTANNISLTILQLRFNVGQQAAIFQGLLYAQSLPCECFIIMDADGEDSPAALPELIATDGADIVHVVRGKRQEGLVFKMSYAVYKFIFWLVTGKKMNFGNYCMINRKILESAIFHSFNHLAAFLSKQRATRSEIISSRDKRLDGKSKMGFKGLLSHAFKSFVEYGEDLLLIFLKFFIVIMGVVLLGVGNIIYQKFIAHTAILGWTSNVIIGLLNMAIISIGFFILGILLLNLSNQKNNNVKTKIYDEVDIP